MRLAWAPHGFVGRVEGEAAQSLHAIGKTGNFLISGVWAMSFVSLLKCASEGRRPRNDLALVAVLLDRAGLTPEALAPGAIVLIEVPDELHGALFALLTRTFPTDRSSTSAATGSDEISGSFPLRPTTRAACSLKRRPRGRRAYSSPTLPARASPIRWCQQAAGPSLRNKRNCPGGDRNAVRRPV